MFCWSNIWTLTYPYPDHSNAAHLFKLQFYKVVASLWEWSEPQVHIVSAIKTKLFKTYCKNNFHLFIYFPGCFFTFTLIAWGIKIGSDEIRSEFMIKITH